MISKREMCEYIIKNGSCQGMACVVCSFDETCGGMWHKGLSSYAKYWLDRHPKKEKQDNVENVAPATSEKPKWEPKVGDIVVYWNHPMEQCCPASLYPGCKYKGSYYVKGVPWEHVALVKDLSEVGKPASYFMKRGDWV
jgi:hypothetical protein